MIQSTASQDFMLMLFHHHNFSSNFNVINLLIFPVFHFSFRLFSRLCSTSRERFSRQLSLLQPLDALTRGASCVSPRGLVPLNRPSSHKGHPRATGGISAAGARARIIPRTSFDFEDPGGGDLRGGGGQGGGGGESAEASGRTAAESTWWWPARIMTTRWSSPKCRIYSGIVVAVLIILTLIVTLMHQSSVNRQPQPHLGTLVGVVHGGDQNSERDAGGAVTGSDSDGGRTSGTSTLGKGGGGGDGLAVEGEGVDSNRISGENG